jgi:diaminohydroxyphosphoribosylaminopyrimidine deaminase/5-amino-6-(5-phosphoribosylamino)uracil reductase
MAIMAGTGTILKDDPELTVRMEEPFTTNPVRVILDARGRIPLTAKVLSDGKAETIVALTEKTPAARIEALRKHGIHIIPCPEKDKGIDLPFLMLRLAEHGIDSVLLEGGGTLNFTALRDGIVDKVYTFVAPKIIGGKEAPTPVEGEGYGEIGRALELTIINTSRFGDDLLIEAYLKKD